MLRITNSDNKAAIQRITDTSQACMIEALKLDSELLNKETMCPKNITHIDHLTLDFQFKSIHEFDMCKILIFKLLRVYKIRLTSSKPRTLNKFDDGNILSRNWSGKRCGCLKFTDDKSSLRLELNGNVCAPIYGNPHGFYFIYYLANNYKAIIRRIDIAYDDFSGKYGLRRAGKDYSAKKYKSKTGCNPIIEKIKSSSGSCWYIGSKNSDKFLRIYEKGKQIGAEKLGEEHSNWIRHEVVLKNRGKVNIPLDTILNTDGIFVSSYPLAHKKMVKGVEPISITRIRAIPVAVKVIGKQSHLHKQYGRTINQLSQLFDPDKLIESIRRTDKPSANFYVPDDLQEDVKVLLNQL
jgi:DNA relaxase NicK